MGTFRSMAHEFLYTCCILYMKEWVLIIGYLGLVFLDRIRPFDFWIWFSYGYGWLGLHIWWWMIWCCLIFRSTIHLMPYWGIFPFRLRFIDLHRVTWSSSLMRCMSSWWSTIILSWSPSGVSLGPFNQTHTFRHLDIIMLLLLLGNASLTFGSDLAVDMDD